MVTSNPCMTSIQRLEYICKRTDLNAGPTVDVGCGGGILSESLAVSGVETVGIDMAGKALGVAKLHALEAGVAIDYQESTAEQLAAQRAGEFRTVTCMEMLEHVTAYADTVAACAELAQPGGDLFFRPSTAILRPMHCLFWVRNMC